MKRLALTVMLIISLVPAVRAEVRTITATGEYRMGDNDTRTDAKRLALQDAKRLALEKAGTYIESLTELKNFAVSKDEVRAYTAELEIRKKLAVTCRYLSGSTGNNTIFG